jgi:hypothetical protein
MTDPAAPHPSDSERTPRTDRFIPDVLRGVGHRDEHGNIIQDYHMCGCRQVPAESERVSLDVTRMRKALVNLHRILDGERPMADQIVAEYARLSPSTGKEWPDTANQDAGGIPYWPDASSFVCGTHEVYGCVMCFPSNAAERIGGK